MQNRIVEWNPQPDSNQFVVGNSGKIELLEFEQLKSDKPVIKKYKDIYTHPHAVQSVVCTCLNWHPDQTPQQSIIAYGTSIGEVKALNWYSNFEVSIYIFFEYSRMFNFHFQLILFDFLVDHSQSCGGKSESLYCCVLEQTLSTLSCSGF